MKKTYFLLMATAIAVSGASLETRANKTTLHPDYLPKAETSVEFNLNAFKPQKQKRPLTIDVAPRDVDAELKGLEGTWTFLVGDNCFEGSKGYVPVEFVATVEDETNKIIAFSNPDYYTLKARYNTKTHSVTFTRRIVENEEGNYVYQEPYSYDPETKEFKKKSIVGYYNDYERAIVFDDNLGVMLTAYNDKSGKELKGYYDVLELPIGYLPPAGEWVPVGNAKFTDGWLAPGFNVTEGTTYDVPLEMSAENDKLFRLVNPYKYGPLAIDNESEGGYIVFDVSDPSHVIFKFSDAGYANKDRRCTHFFVSNCMGSLVLINPYYTPDEVKAQFPDFPATELQSNGVIAMTNGEKYDVSFFLQDMANSPRYWKDADGKIAPVKAEIALPEEAGVSSLVNEDAATEYFNVEGIRISKPEPGQIVIKRQGTVVTKEIFK